MAEWPGGPCPDCGENVPARVVRCRTCGAMLNTDLQPRHLSIPEPVELPEVEVVIDTYVKGYFVGCPNCEAELRIAGKYLGQTVQCKFCTAPFKFALKEPSIKWIAVYSECANCQQEIRAALKYLGKKVACKLCEGGIRLIDPNG